MSLFLNVSIFWSVCNNQYFNIFVLPLSFNLITNNINKNFSSFPTILIITYSYYNYSKPFTWAKSIWISLIHYFFQNIITSECISSFYYTVPSTDTQILISNNSRRGSFRYPYNGKSTRYKNTSKWFFFRNTCSYWIQSVI